MEIISYHNLYNRAQRLQPEHFGIFSGDGQRVTEDRQRDQRPARDIQIRGAAFGPSFTMNRNWPSGALK